MSYHNPEKERLFGVTYFFWVIKGKTRFSYYPLITSQPSSCQIILAPPRLASSWPLSRQVPRWEDAVCMLVLKSILKIHHPLSYFYNMGFYTYHMHTFTHVHACFITHSPLRRFEQPERFFVEPCRKQS